MRTAMLITATFTALWLAPVAARAQDEAQRLLEQADRYRAGWPAFLALVRIDNFDRDRLVESADFEVSVKGENSLVKFLSPKSKGQSLLMRGDDLWFLLPSVARPVRITPIQRLLGNTSNGDLARLRYAVDYTATVAGEETIDGVACIVLDLIAKRKSATYQRVRYAVRKSDAMPVRAECFVGSGKHLKTAFFEAPRQFAGREVISRIRILDALRSTSTTVMEFTAFAPRELPDKIFSPVRTSS